MKKSAENNFKNGLYCAESVVLSITEAHGIKSDLLPKVATAFCSGMSRTCGTCGALTGAVMGISAVLGRNSADESVEETYKATGLMVEKFENKFENTFEDSFNDNFEENCNGKFNDNFEVCFI